MLIIGIGSKTEHRSWLCLQRDGARAHPRGIVRGDAGSVRGLGPGTETGEDPARARRTDAGPGQFILDHCTDQQ